MLIEYDYVIIGSGPAGSTLAYQLSKKKFKIAIIDRADYINFKISNYHNPYIAEFSKNYLPLFSNKIGGNSALWHNKIYLLTKDEFDEGKWKFKYNILRKFSEDLAKKLNINHDNFKIEKDKINFSQSYRSSINNVYDYLKINKLKNVHLYKNTSPIKILFKKKVANQLIVKSIDKKIDIKIKIKKSIIFCAGGLGNPHLLLNLLERGETLVNIKDHPHIKIGKINKINKFREFGKFFITRKNIEKNIFIKNKLFSGIQLSCLSAHDKILGLKKNYIRQDNLINKFFIIFLIANVFIFYKFYFYVQKKLNRFNYCFEFFFSQNNNTNCINLNNKITDKFGLKKINIKWETSATEKKYYNLIINKFFKINKILNQKKESFNESNIYVGLHPSCSTPISNKKELLSVDKNLKVLEYKNIYVCGSSVFPENGFTNPTWTIMVLANRLAQHLIKKQKI
jgi:hypothetical protein